MPDSPTTSNLARLQTMKNLLLGVSHSMGASSPDKVLNNFIEVLKNASPQIKFAIVFLTPWAMLFAAVSRYAWVCNGCKLVRNFLTSYVCASVSIPGSHPLNKQILAYMTEQGLGMHARSLALNSPQAEARKRMSSYYEHMIAMQGYPSAQSSRKKQLLSNNDEDEEQKEKQLSYIPEVGDYVFWWHGYRMNFERRSTYQEQIDGQGRRILVPTQSGNETIVISCLSLFSGARPIKNFLNDIKSTPAKDRTTTIYRPDGRTWDQGITRPSRNLNAVTLDSSVKDTLVKDIETYLSPQTRKYYANRGIPWKRGVLLYGHPGCGKTSFTNALAGHFDLNVYMISLSSNSLSDDMLEDLFEQLPSRCIVLLEDIDSAGIKRESMREKSKMETKPTPRQQVYDQYGRPILDTGVPGGVTLSGLLNVLDGIHSKEGMVTIMTSNSPNSLDPALVRPGRIDRKVLFGYASKEVTAKLFRHIFEKSPEELVDGERSNTTPEISKLADQFADLIPADKLTPAEVQGFLLVHRADPVVAISEAAEWAEKTIETKAKGANVASFVSETNQDTDEGASSRRTNSDASSKAEDSIGPSETNDKDVVASEDLQGFERESIDSVVDIDNPPEASNDFFGEGDLNTNTHSPPNSDLTKMLSRELPKELSHLVGKAGIPPTPPSSRSPSRSRVKRPVGSVKTMSKGNMLSVVDTRKVHVRHHSLEAREIIKYIF